MNVITFCGGLGNQFYQYAFGKTMELYGHDVAFNSTWYNKKQETPRDLSIKKFNVNITESNIRQQTINESAFSIRVNNSNLERVLVNGNYKGYWQHPKYYRLVVNKLKKEFCLRPEFYTEEFSVIKDKILNAKDSVMLHIRRGDYVTKNSCYVLPLQYYYEALLQVKGDLFIFSDDIEYCKEKFKSTYFNRNIEFIDLPDYQSFELMKYCKLKIIANSTFSYWAALLNDNENDVVIAPKYWRVKNEMLIGLPHAYPKNWRSL